MNPISKTIEISTPFIKLDSLLKFAGLAVTGGQAKEMIIQGSVLVNGESTQQRGRKVRPGDQVQVDHVTIEVCGSAFP